VREEMEVEEDGGIERGLVSPLVQAVRLWFNEGLEEHEEEE